MIHSFLPILEEGKGTEYRGAVLLLNIIRLMLEWQKLPTDGAVQLLNIIRLMLEWLKTSYRNVAVCNL